MGRSLKLLTLVMVGLTLVSSLALAVNIVFPEWQNGLNSITIVKGNSAYFDMTLHSANPPMDYTVILFNERTNTPVSTVETGTIHADVSDVRVVIGPADYNYIGGDFLVRIIAQDAIGHSMEDFYLRLHVTNIAPTIVGMIPDLSLEEGESDTIDLSLYEFDADDTSATLSWSVSGNSNVAVSINPTTHVATFTAPTGWTGSETLTFTLTDTSGDSDTDTMTVTVTSASGSSSSERRVMNVDHIGVESFGDGMILVRNNGGEFEDVKLTLEIEAPNAPENEFRFSMDSNTVKYFDIDTEGIESGDYLALVEMSCDDTDSKGYIFVYI